MQGVCILQKWCTENNLTELPVKAKPSDFVHATAETHLLAALEAKPFRNSLTRAYLALLTQLSGGAAESVRLAEAAHDAGYDPDGRMALAYYELVSGRLLPARDVVVPLLNQRRTGQAFYLSGWCNLLISLVLKEEDPRQSGQMLQLAAQHLGLSVRLSPKAYWVPHARFLLGLAGDPPPTPAGRPPAGPTCRPPAAASGTSRASGRPRSPATTARRTIWCSTSPPRGG